MAAFVWSLRAVSGSLQTINRPVQCAGVLVHRCSSKACDSAPKAHAGYALAIEIESESAW